MTALNLDCLTQWRPCVDEEEAMPGVFRRTMEDNRLLEAQEMRQKSCDYPLAMRFAAADRVTVVHVLEGQPSPHPLQVPVRLLRALKGMVPPVPKGEYGLYEMNAGSKRHPQDFAPGSDLLVMSGAKDSREDAAEFTAYQCGVVRADATVLATIQQGRVAR